MRIIKCLGAVVLFASSAFSAIADWREISQEINHGVESLQPPIGPYNLSVDYKNSGLVTLEGKVSSSADKLRVASIAEGTKGVTSVVNNLVVDPSTARVAAPKSSATTEAVMKAFGERIVNRGYKVSVVEDAGSLRVTGTVDSEATRAKVLDVARSVSKLPVSDQLSLTPSRPDDEIRESILNDVKKQFPALASQIKNLEVDAGVVHISGDMKDHWDIDKVLTLVVMTDGVRDLKNEITIQGQPYLRRSESPKEK